MYRRTYLAGACLALAGCSGSEGRQRDDSEVYRSALRETLEADGITVRDITVEDAVVDLEYEPAEPTEESVEESIHTTARAYYDRVYGGWEVDRLNSGVHVDETLVATWHMESQWVQQHRDGDISRGELGEKVEETVEQHEEES